MQVTIRVTVTVEIRRHGTIVVLEKFLLKWSQGESSAAC